MNAYYYELLSNKFHYLLECFGISISLRSRKNLCVVCGVLASLLMNHGLMLESRVSVPFSICFTRDHCAFSFLLLRQDGGHPV
jgi:hypothetical protein